MTRPIDLVLSRAEGHGLRSSGRDRWRMVGACHGGSNPSAVSIGVGNTDSVLLKCWHGCSVEEVAHALGLELVDLFPSQLTGSPPIRRRGVLSASQALDLLHDEAQLIVLCAHYTRNGVPLDDDDIDRVLQAAQRIAYLRDEVMT